MRAGGEGGEGQECGALGAATHLARLVPQHRVRAMMYTSDTATAAELHGYGSVLDGVPRATRST